MRALAFGTTVAALTLLVGCDLGTWGASSKTDWASARKADISCLDNVDVVHEDYYDLNGDGRAEVFLVMRCRSGQDPRGDQLEVIAGDMDPDTANPTKLVLQMPDPAVVDGLCFANKAAIYRVTVAGKPKVWQVKWSKDAAEPGPPTAGPARGCP
jgi:hypothetical protein